MSFVDRSGELGAPEAIGVPTVCVIPGLNIYTITYRENPPIFQPTSKNHMHKLWRDTQGNARWIDITENIPPGAPFGSTNPFAVINTKTNNEFVLWQGRTGFNQAAVFDSWHFWPNSDMGWENLSDTAHAPRPELGGSGSGHPVGYYDPKFDLHVVYYMSSNGHLHNLFWQDGDNVSYDGDLTNKANPPAPLAQGGLSAFFNKHGDHIVVYRSRPDGHICFLRFRGPDPPVVDRVSLLANTPLAAPDFTGQPPAAYYLEQNDTHQIVYRGIDRHLYEIFWETGGGFRGSNLTQAAGAPLAAQSPLAYYHAGTNKKHAIYINDENHMIDISWFPGDPFPQFEDLTTRFSLPHASPVVAAAFTIEGETQHIVFLHSPLPNHPHVFELIR